VSYSPADMRTATKLAEKPGFFDRPVVILSAPRSGSTLLYELLTRSAALWSIGGESHFIIEDLAGLDPADGRVRSNRLIEARDDVAHIIRAGFAIAARRCDGQRLVELSPMARPPSIRFAEKTPKNMLRVPFMRAIFPDCRFVLLSRDPREAMSSMIEAWESQTFVTYAKLPGFEGPWSMLLPDGYERLSGRTIEECVAFQWSEANRIALDDLAAIDKSDWCHVRYSDLIRDPAAALRAIATTIELDMSDVIASVGVQGLPISTHTLSAPKPGKWQRHAARLAPVLPLVSDVEQRLLTI
jgi:hypothetical protein